MKLLKKLGIIMLLLLLVGAVCFGLYCMNNWTIRFQSELDRFFGAGNWSCVSGEGKDSIIYDVTIRNSRGDTESVPGRYRNWVIAFRDKDGGEVRGKITNHAAKINHDRYWIFSSRRLSDKQALVLELMDLSHWLIERDLEEEIAALNLPELVTGNIRVRLSYHGGNPRPKFYTRLWEESWFNLRESSAERFLALDSHDFYILVTVDSTLAEDLTEAELQILSDGLSSIEKHFLQAYGQHASFEISFGQVYAVEYARGEKRD